MATRRIPLASLNDVRSKLNEYRELLAELERNGTLAGPTTATYLVHAENFVRWLEGEWVPGSRAAQRDEHGE
jgi:hypothetical protein